MKSKFLKPNNPLLQKKAKDIPISKIPTKKTQKIIKLMLKIAQGEQRNNKKPVMVGLAAPQIGILKRIILVDIKADGKGEVGDLRVYINPKISWVSKEKTEWYEGCFSTSRICGIVERPISIKIKAYLLTPQGCNVIEEKFTDYTARIFQHEIDHLNGIRFPVRFPDLITNPDNLHWVKKSEFPIYRNKQAWRNWNKKCSFEKWKKLKNPLV